MPRRGENIFKRKDGRWEGRYIREHVEGRAVYGYVYDKTYTEVRKKLEEAKDAVRERKKHPINIRMSCEEWFDYWLETLVRPYVKESTYARYWHSMHGHLIPGLGRLRLNNLSETDVQQFLNSLTSDSKPLAVSTIRALFTLLRACLDKARQLGYCNVLLEQVKLPKQPAPKCRVLTLDEQARLEQRLQEGDYSTQGIFISLYTGLRVGELCALKWEDIDLERLVLRVRSTVQRIKDVEQQHGRKTKLTEGMPKSDTSSRDIPLAGFMVERIRTLRDNRPFPDCPYVLCGKSGASIEPRTYQYRFQKLMKELDIEGVTFHTLRHTFATRSVEVGFDIKSLSEILGHSGADVTIRRYIHSLEEQKRRNMGLLESIYRQ